VITRQSPFRFNSERGITRFPHGKELVGVRDWLVARLRASSHIELDDLSIEEAGGDDERAFDALFVYWDEYQALNQ
jgi:hypothetical protein